MRALKRYICLILAAVMTVLCLPAQSLEISAESIANRDTKTISDIKNADGSPVRIACIGDSITYGTMISNTAQNAYPAKLGKLLGDGYDVQNFGRPSSYLLAEDSPYNVRAGKNLCYTDLPQYTASKDFAPNVVIIMLGTNDMMSMVDEPSCNAVKDALVSLVRSYQALSSVVRVYVMTSIFSQIEYTYFLTSDGGLQAVQKKAAAESGAEFADIYSLTKGYFDVMLHRVDRLHPDNASSEAIPRAVYSILTGTDYYGPEAPVSSSGIVFVSDSGSMTNDGASAATPINNIAYAAGLLRKTGGTIVVCGEQTIANNGTFMPEGDVKIKITSKYGGVDYRSTNSARLVVHSGNFYIGMPTEFDNITIYSSNNAKIVCGYNDTVFGQNVTCTVASGVGYPSIIAGHNIANGAPTVEQVSYSGECNITVNGGSWNYIRCGNLRASDKSTTGIIKGSVIATVNGGSFNNSSVSAARNMDILEGTARVIINGGTHAGRMVLGRASSATGYSYIEINGGSFTSNIVCPESTTGRAKVLLNTANISVGIQGNGNNSKAYLKEGISESLKSKFTSFGEVGTYAPVVFVRDGGTGNGLSASSPLGDINAAYSKLSSNGGTVVICGQYTMKGNITEPRHDAPVTLTQKYNGTDYRSLGKLSTGGEVRKYELNGVFKLENIFIEGGANAGLFIIAQYNLLTVGEGVKTFGFSGELMADSLTLIGGFNSSTTPLRHGSGDSHIEVHSGNGMVVAGMNRYMTNTHPRSSHIDIYGGEIGRIYGGNVSGGTGVGAYVNIYGGKLVGSVDLSTGTSTESVFTAAYGDYTACPSIKGGDGSSRAVVYNRVYDEVHPLLSGFDNLDKISPTVYVRQNATGCGSSADTATGTISAAYTKLGDNGGTIVICGSFAMQGNFTEPLHSGSITITQKYNGIDYSEGGSFSTGGTSRGYYLSGETVFENISISTTNNAGLIIIARYNPVEIGAGVKCTGFDGNTVASSLSIIGGYNTSSPETGSGEGDAHITVRSGNGILIAGLNRYLNQKTERNAFINIYGGNIGKVYGGCINGGEGGNVTALFDGGVYNGAVDLGYGAGGKVELTAKNGNFNSCPYIIGKQGSACAVVYARFERTLIARMREFDNIDIYSAVVYLKQGASGNGSSADDPTGTITNAYARLGDNGGTIVIIGAFEMQASFIAPINIGTVTITGIYNGIDYRSGGAFTTGGAVRRFDINGPTVFENINISTSDNAGLLIVANYNPIEIGTGVVCSGFAGNTVSDSLTILGGKNGTAAPLVETGLDAHITVRSGSGMLIAGLNRYINNTHSRNAVIDIYGGEVVTLYGGNINGGSGATAEINLYGGRFTGSIQCAYGISKGVKLNIYGGNFDACTNISGNYSLECDALISDEVLDSVMQRIYGFIGLVEKGDVDLDMRITNTDISLLVRYLSGYAGDAASDFADVNEDGVINNRDAIKLIKILAK